MSRNQGLPWWGQTHLLHEGILQGKVIPSVDQQLIFEVLWRMEVLAWRLLSVTPALDAVVAGSDAAVLHLHVGRGVRELALSVRARALVPLELPAHFQLQPARVLPVQQVVHVDHGHAGGGGARRVGGCRRGRVAH